MKISFIFFFKLVYRKMEGDSISENLSNIIYLSLFISIVSVMY